MDRTQVRIDKILGFLGGEVVNLDAAGTYKDMAAWQKRVKQALDERRWNLSTLADATGIRENTIRGWFKHPMRIPKADDAIRVARILDVTVEELFDPDAQWPPSRPTPPRLEDAEQALQDALRVLRSARTPPRSPPRKGRKDV